MSRDNKKRKKELSETRLVHNDNASTNGFWPDVSLAAQILLPLAFLAVVFSKKIAAYPFQHYVTGFWPTVNHKQRLLKWLTDRIPYMSNTPQKISQYWKDGSLLCTLINTVVPGACPNPQQHWKKPPIHAQALAYKYLGIPPVLSTLEFAENLDKKSESKFISYLYSLQEAINKLTVDSSSLNFTNKYIARGMGLIIGEQNKTSTFYIYPNADNDKLENIFINIKGPYASFGKEVISAGSMSKSMRKFMKARNESAREKKKMTFRGRSQSYLFRSLSFDLGPLMELWTKTKTGDITIKINIEPDRARVEFYPTHSGIYELLLTTNGEHIRGSPFVIRVTKKLEELSSENTLTKKIMKTNTGRRIISKTIDFIDETMDLGENNVMFLKIDHNNNNKKDNQTNENIEYMEIVQKSAMKKVMYTDEIGDNIMNARKHNQERKFEKYIKDTLEEAEKVIKETSGEMEELDLNKWAYLTVEETSKTSEIYVEKTPAVESEQQVLMEDLSADLKKAQKKIEDQLVSMEEKSEELDNIVNQFNLHQESPGSEKNEDSILESFEIEPYSDEEREFERLYKESLYSNVVPQEDSPTIIESLSSDTYPISDGDSYIFEAPVKEPKPSIMQESHEDYIDDFTLSSKQSSSNPDDAMHHKSSSSIATYEELSILEGFVEDANHRKKQIEKNIAEPSSCSIITYEDPSILHSESRGSSEGEDSMETRDLSRNNNNKLDGHSSSSMITYEEPSILCSEGQESLIEEDTNIRTSSSSIITNEEPSILYSEVQRFDEKEPFKIDDKLIGHTSSSIITYEVPSILYSEEDNTLGTKPSEDDVTFSSIIETVEHDDEKADEETTNSSGVLSDDFSDGIRNNEDTRVYKTEIKYYDKETKKHEYRDNERDDIFKKDAKLICKDIINITRETYQVREFQTNHLTVQKDSGFLSVGEESVRSIKDIKNLFEEKTKLDKSKSTDFLQDKVENIPASPILVKNIELEAQQPETTEDSAYPNLDDQLSKESPVNSLENSDDEHQVNVFEIRLKYEKKIQESNIQKKTKTKPTLSGKLSTTKSLPNLMGHSKFEDEAQFLNSTDSLNEFVIQFKEKKEFWDRLAENSSCSSLNSSMSDVPYQNALKMRGEHRSEMSQSHSCLNSGEFECIDEEKNEEIVEEALPKDFSKNSAGVMDRIRVFEKDFDSQKCTNLLNKTKQKSLRSLTSFNSIKNTEELADIPLNGQRVEENLNFAEDMKKRFESAKHFFTSIEKADSANPRNVKLQRHSSYEDKDRLQSNLPRRSESMQALNVSERFSVDNLYRDVIFNKMQNGGSFRGSPNKAGVAETLASMSSTESGLEKDFRDDDDLDMAVFNAKRPTKLRKSVKSVFEVNY